MTEKRLHPSYVALARVAMIGGVPLMAGLIVFAVMVITALTCAFTLGPAGFLAALVPAPIFFFIRDVCKNDDQALRIVRLEMQCRWRLRGGRRGFLKGKKDRLFGATYTLSPIRYGRHIDDYVRATTPPATLIAHRQFVTQFMAQLAAQRKAEK